MNVEQVILRQLASAVINSSDIDLILTILTKRMNMMDFLQYVIRYNLKKPDLIDYATRKYIEYKYK